MNLLCNLTSPLELTQPQHLFGWDIASAIHQRSIILPIFFACTDALKNSQNLKKKVCHSKPINCKLGQVGGHFAVLGKLHRRVFNFYKSTLRAHPTIK